MTIRCFLSFWIFSAAAANAFAQDMGAFNADPNSPAAVGFEHQYMAPPAGLGSLWVAEEKVSGRVPVFKTENRSLAVTAKAERTRVGEHLSFKNRGVDIPQEFGTIEGGLAWSQKSEDGKAFGVSATVGSAGQRLLGNGYTPIVTGNMIWDRPVDENHSWIYFLNYSNNRTILNNIPIPGFGYSIKTATSRMILGLPFLFYARFGDPWVITSIVSPFVMAIDAGYRFWGPLQAYGAAGWTPRAYQNLVRDSSDRLLFDKKEIGAGIRFLMGRKGSVSLGYVYNFHRRFMLGRSVNDDNSSSIALDNSGGYQLRARLSF